MKRRTFISTLATTGAVLATQKRLSAATESRPATVGIVGCGWFGPLVYETLAKHFHVTCIALCDPDALALEKTAKMIAGHQRQAPRTFADFRAMLEAGVPNIALISTPDHWHALPAIACMEAGADLILEKPISCDVIEGEAIVAAARKYKRVVQVNLQRRSTRCLAEARDRYLRSGRIGKLRVVETYSYLHGRSADAVAPSAPPATLDYDLWTGPAPLLPYRDVRWRNFDEYGNGQIGDLGVHMIDTARWMLDLHWPESISSTGGILVDTEASATITDTQRSVFSYPGLDLIWEHRTWGAPPIPSSHWTDLWGARFLGSAGTLRITIFGYEFVPADGGPREGYSMLSDSGDLENINPERVAAALEEIHRDHLDDFMRARVTRMDPISGVEQGHISSAACILANLALKLDRPLAYDPATRTVVNDAEATRALARAYRAPWVHPDPSSV